MKFTVEILSQYDGPTRHLANIDFSHYGSFDTEAAAEGFLVSKRWVPYRKIEGNSWIGCLEITPKIEKTATTLEVPEKIRVAFARVTPVVRPITFADTISFPRALGEVPQIMALAA